MPRRWHKKWRSGRVRVEIFDIDYDTYIGRVTTPAGSRVEAASLEPDRQASSSLRALEEAAEVLIDVAMEPDAPDGTPAKDIRIQQYAEFCPRGWPIVTKG